MGYVCDEAEIHALIDQINPRDEDAAALLAEELGRCGEPAIAPLLELLLNGSNLHLKPYLAWALVRLMGADDFIHAVSDRLTRPINPSGRQLFLTMIRDLMAEASPSVYLRAIIQTVNHLTETGDLIGADILAYEADAIPPLIEALTIEAAKPVESTNAHSTRLMGLIALLGQLDDPHAQETALAATLNITHVQWVARLRDNVKFFHSPTYIRRLIAILEANDAPELHISNTLTLLIGARTPEVVSAVIAVIDQTDGSARTGAIMTLGNSGDPRAIPPLVKIIDQRENAVAVLMLGQLKHKDAIPHLLGYLHTAEAKYQCVAAATLANYPRPDVAAALVETLRLDDPKLHKSARQALDAMPEIARPHLRQLFDEQPDIVRRVYNMQDDELIASARSIAAAQNPDSLQGRTQVAQRSMKKLRQDCPLCGTDWGELTWLELHRQGSHPKPGRVAIGMLTYCDDCQLQVQYEQYE
jgi:HEAT repeat protein